MKPPLWFWLVFGLLVVVSLSIVRFTLDQRNRKRRTLVSERVSNVRALTMLIAMRADRRGTWPPWNGKRFVLSVVAYGDVKLEKPEYVQVFFGDYRKPGALPEASAYSDITEESLTTLPVAGLTSYAGRRNAEARYRLPAGEAPHVPILADLSLPDLAIVGFASGRVQVLERDELGLAPEDPIVVGDESRSGILRALSGE